MRTIGTSSAKLRRLRPVTFNLKTDPTDAVQYGLIAEQVAGVYPELVVRNAAGRIEGVRCEELAPMLLNELQQQQAKLAVQSREMSQMRRQLLQLTDLNREMLAALSRLQKTNRLLAVR